MAIEGSLATTTITQLFNLIKLAKKSGTLHVYATPGGESLVELDFRDGQVVFALAKDKHSDLIYILRKYGKLNDHQVQKIRANRLGNSEKSLALMLVNGNFVTQKDITQSVQRYIIDIVLDLMTWREGTFSFDENAPPRADRIATPLNLDDILKLGAKQMDAIKRFESAIPNLDIPLRLAQERAKTLQLTGKQWQVMGLIAPHTTIRQIARQCHFTDTEIREIVCQLMDANIVELVESAG